MASSSLQKIYSRSSLSRKAKNLRQSGKKIVFTNGCFDILHAGHVQYLQKAKDMGDFLVIGLNSDQSVRKLKGKNRPVNSQKDRAEVLAALSSVDAIGVFSEETPLKLIKAVRPHVLVKGGDWALKSIVGYKEVKSWKGSVKRISFLKGRSTSGTLKKISRL